MYQLNDMICILYIRDNKIGSIIPTVFYSLQKL